MLFSLSINIGGTAVPLDVRHGDVPKNVAASFAEEYKVTHNYVSYSCYGNYFIAGL